MVGFGCILALSQRRLTAETGTVVKTTVSESDNTKATSSVTVDDSQRKQEVSILSSGSSTTPSGVAVTNYVNRGWLERPQRNLLVVIHPWCMLRKSNADARQSEFPPPGFLERLKAKLLALHRETDAGQQRQCPKAAAAATAKRRRNNNQKIKCWVQYTAAVAAAAALGGSRVKTIAATSVATPYRQDKSRQSRDAVDFLSMRQRYVKVAAASENPVSYTRFV